MLLGGPKGLPQPVAEPRRLDPLGAQHVRRGGLCPLQIKAFGVRTFLPPPSSACANSGPTGDRPTHPLPQLYLIDRYSYSL